MVTISVYLSVTAVIFYSSIELYEEELKSFKATKWINDQKNFIEEFCGGYHSAEVIRKEEYGRNNMKIYLSPSSQKENKYKSGNTTEAAVCEKIAKAAETALKRNGYTVKRGSINSTVSERIKESNNWGADVHQPIHTNAGGGDGTLVMCYTGRTGNKYVKNVYNSVAALSPGKDDGIKVRTDLAEITDTEAMCVYLECEFHDDADLATWIINHTTEIGEAIAEGYCKADGKTYKGTSSGATESRPIKYYVQCGAFSDKKNAEALAKKLKKDGYEVYIKTS